MGGGHFDWGPRDGPQTPKRSKRPGGPGALLEDAATGSPEDANAPADPGRFATTQQPAPPKTRTPRRTRGASRRRSNRLPRRRERPGGPGALLEDAATGSPEDANAPADPGRFATTQQPAPPKTRTPRRTRGASRRRSNRLPRRRERPGGPGALLEDAATGSPEDANAPADPGRFATTQQPAPPKTRTPRRTRGASRRRSNRLPRRRERPGGPGALLEDAATGSPEDANAPADPGRFATTQQPAPPKTRTPRRTRGASRRRSNRLPRRRERPGGPGALRDDAATGSPEDANAPADPGRFATTQQPAPPKTRTPRRTRGASRRRSNRLPRRRERPGGPGALRDDAATGSPEDANAPADPWRFATTQQPAPPKTRTPRRTRG